MEDYAVALLTLDELTNVMRYYAALESIPPNDTWKTIDPDVPLSQYLPGGGAGSATPARLFKGAVRYVLNSRGNTLKTWPKAWLNMSINALAAQII